MMKEVIPHLLDNLAEWIDASGRSDRDIERSLGASHGWLRLLLQGRIDLKVRHLEELGAVLGFTVKDFFLRAYGGEGALTLARLKIAPSIQSVRGERGKNKKKSRKQTHLSAAARLEVRELIYVELAKVRGELPAGTGDPQGEESPGEGETELP